MSHRAGANRPVRRRHDLNKQPCRIAAAQMELMAEAVRRLTLALHELSLHESAPPGPPRHHLPGAAGGPPSRAAA